MSLEQIAAKLGKTDAVCAAVNGRIRELSYLMSDDAEVEFLGLDTHDGMRIYEATLRYVFAMATYRINPSLKIRFSYSVSRSILATITNGDVTDELYEKIVQEVKKIVSEKLTIKRLSVSKQEATKIYTNYGYLDKIETLKLRQEDQVNLYQAGNYVNYMFSYMLPNTSLLTIFDTKFYAPGFLIFYPRAELQGKLPEFVDQVTFGKTLKEAYKWGKIIGGDTIANINKHVETRDAEVDFVNLCETKHNDQLAELGNLIAAQIDDIKLIAVAGPSSSGKTTFTNRLRIELMAKGIKPKMISMDDYYKPKTEAPKDSDGKPDLEHVEALDIDRFNRDMASLVQGKEVSLPHFDFKLGKRVEGPKIKLEKNSPILIEGIHALNDRLTTLIPSHQKFKIFIAPQTQIHIDEHNPISLTDLRLLRRMVRDQKYRSTPADMTIEMWPSVRRGEFRWIYPNQEGVNYVFNSELSYELLVLKKYAIPHLSQIDRSHKHFITANRLVKFLKYFKDIDEKLIPSNSLLLEFIGGSPFHD
ncbi:nucleoside kinase [Acholeplasma equirhinis]|uniref:nucleoside kinase n=1 Tax=Acholeplasma equirhinis TaxID=555393 RepID=UPI00197A905B|nr:nucleoside kinase [Acholeplasma equirhinis]MBN3490636.1 nucleoside kinase [Acholeplasma equirhinis]